MAQVSTGFWNYRRGGAGPPIAPPPSVFNPPAALPRITYVIYVGRADGTVIGELAGALESVAWATDGYGMATLILPARAELPDAYGPLLEFGNRVCIEFTGGLPPWGGVIDVPRETTLGQTRVQMYEGGYLLTQVLTPGQALYIGSEARPAGAILRDLVGTAALGFGLSEIGEEGAPVEAEFHYDTVAAAADKLRSLDGTLHYFLRARPATGGRIDFDLVAFRRALADHTDRAVLIQGHNLVDWSVLEQGPIYNEVLVGVGGFLNPAEADGYSVLHTAVDDASGRRYGRRQRPPEVLVEVEGESGPGRAVATANARLATYGRPRVRVRGTALNLSPGLYRDYGIGSRIRIEAATPMATREEAVVIGMSFEPGTGTLSLVFDDSEG